MAAHLAKQEIETVGSCLKAAAYGEFFPDWEFSTLFGVDREVVKAVADAWPDADTDDKNIRAIIVNSMNHLLGYPHGDEDEWKRYISKSPEEVKQALEKLLAMGY